LPDQVARVFRNRAHPLASRELKQILTKAKNEALDLVSR
jgi:hypothetical protein